MSCLLCSATPSVPWCIQNRNSEKIDLLCRKLSYKLGSVSSWRFAQVADLLPLQNLSFSAMQRSLDDAQSRYQQPEGGCHKANILARPSVSGFILHQAGHRVEGELWPFWKCALTTQSPRLSPRGEVYSPFSLSFSDFSFILHLIL